MQTVPDEASVFGNKRWLGVNSGQSDDVVGAESDFFGAYRMLTGDLWMGGRFAVPRDDSCVSNEYVRSELREGT